MNSLEKILIIGGFAVGLPLLGIGLYRDKFPEKYQNNYTLKFFGLLPCAGSAGIIFRKSLEKEDKNYLKSHK
jgi:hypothetical protein